MTEAEFEKNCSDLWGDIEEAIAVFYTSEEINDHALNDEAILDAIQADALFWKVQVYALQTTLFIVLGRIFDMSSDAYSIHKLLRDTGQHFDLLFSHEALRVRKEKEKLNLHPKDLEDYFVGLWVPDRKVVGILNKALARHKDRFTADYLPLRSRYFAHNLLNDGTTIQNLFAKTNRKELEETLLFAKEVVALIQELYSNGRELKLGEIIHDRYREEIRSSAKSVLEKLAREHRNSAVA
jgi:hypothetical protein